MKPSITDAALLATDFPDLELYASGKVRDVYRVGTDRLLFVATDRISAFDYVLATGIPHKGRVLTQLSLFWFEFLKDVVADHLVTADVDCYPAEVRAYGDQLRGRSMLVQRAEIPPRAIDQIVFGTVIPSVQLPNISREVGLAAGLPKSVDAYSVVRACATSLQALTSAADSIALGEIDLALVGGTESMSDVPITYSRPVAQAVVAASRGRNLVEKLQAFQGVSARDLLAV